MILTCPECSTKYLTDPKAIGANGRTVRCAKCSATWFVSAEEAQQAARDKADELALQDNQQAAAEDSVAPEIAKASTPQNTKKGADAILRDKADAEKLRSRRKVITAIWIIPLLLLITAAILAYIFRQDVVNRIPKAATIYKSFGVTVKQAGLEIENPTVRNAIIDGQTVLVVNSAIRNVSTDPQNVPMVQITLHNGAGDMIAEWFVEPKATTLDPKGRLEFASQYPDPPVDAVRLSYDFAPGEG